MEWQHAGNLMAEPGERARKSSNGLPQPAASGVRRHFASDHHDFHELGNSTRRSSSKQRQCRLVLMLRRLLARDFSR